MVQLPAPCQLPVRPLKIGRLTESPRVRYLRTLFVLRARADDEIVVTPQRCYRTPGGSDAPAPETPLVCTQQQQAARGSAIEGSDSRDRIAGERTRARSAPRGANALAPR